MANVCQPSTLRIMICPQASGAQNNVAAVSADSSTICVLMRRLRSSRNRSIAFVVLALFYWLDLLRRSRVDHVDHRCHLASGRLRVCARSVTSPRSARHTPKGSVLAGPHFRRSRGSGSRKIPETPVQRKSRLTCNDLRESMDYALARSKTKR